MEGADHEKTAFATRHGLFEFQVMAFSLCNAPSTFRRLMEFVLAGLQWQMCLVYMDDVIVFGRDFEEHPVRLGEDFERFRQAGLKLKPSKCFLLRPKVPFLGHVISADGVSTDPDKIRAVEQWPTPSNVSGAVFSQEQDGSERVITYTSRVLGNHERRYSTTKKEMLAMVHAIRHFRHYLYGRLFTVRTDHNALKWLQSFKEPEGQVARWLELLAQYDYKIEH